MRTLDWAQNSNGITAPALGYELETKIHNYLLSAVSV